MLELSKRLYTIASLVPNGARVCDIGTDHGYLAIYLKQNNIASTVIATDIREKPLESARANIKKFRVKGIETRLCDGLSAIKPGEADTVIVAGMGGEVIAGILDCANWIKANRKITLILQPMTSAEILRKYLINNGFEIEYEPALSENSKIYSVILAKYTGKVADVPESYYYIGEVDPSRPDGLLYIKKQYKRCSDCANALATIPEKQADFKLYKEATDGIGQKLTYYGD